MAANLKEAEYLADTIAHKIDQLLSERSSLRKEMARVTASTLSQDKALVEVFHKAMIGREAAKLRASRLEHMLMLR